VDVGVEFQISSEGVRHGHDESFCSIFHADPLLNHSGGKNREVLKEMAVRSEDGPEFAWHGKHDA
jgi:hypothetical protein